MVFLNRCQFCRGWAFSLRYAILKVNYISLCYFTTNFGPEYGSGSLQYYILLSVKTHFSCTIPHIYSKDSFNQLSANCPNEQLLKWIASKRKSSWQYSKIRGVVFTPYTLGLTNTPATFACFSVSMVSIIARAVIGSLGVVTHSINITAACSIGALVDIWRKQPGAFVTLRWVKWTVLYPALPTQQNVFLHLAVSRGTNELKTRKTAKKSFALHRLAYKFVVVSRNTT